MSSHFCAPSKYEWITQISFMCTDETSAQFSGIEFDYQFRVKTNVYRYQCVSNLAWSSRLRCISQQLNHSLPFMYQLLPCPGDKLLEKGLSLKIICCPPYLWLYTFLRFYEYISTVKAQNDIFRWYPSKERNVAFCTYFCMCRKLHFFDISSLRFHSSDYNHGADCTATATHTKEVIRAAKIYTPAKRCPKVVIERSCNKDL